MTTMRVQEGDSFAAARRAAREMFPFLAASFIIACFAFSAGETPLPAGSWAAAFLFLAVEQDVRAMRIPNWLTFPALLGAIALGAIHGGLAGAGTSLVGALAALAILFFPFAFRALGAGDVKAVMVLGALWGAGELVQALWWMVIAGGVMAIVFLTAQGGLLDLLKRWALSAKHTFLLRRLVYFGPEAQTAAAQGLPFAVAMGLGASAYQLWGSAWL